MRNRNLLLEPRKQVPKFLDSCYVAIDYRSVELGSLVLKNLIPGNPSMTLNKPITEFSKEKGIVLKGDVFGVMTLPNNITQYTILIRAVKDGTRLTNDLAGTGNTGLLDFLITISGESVTFFQWTNRDGLISPSPNTPPPEFIGQWMYSEARTTRQRAIENDKIVVDRATSSPTVLNPGLTFAARSNIFPMGNFSGNYYGMRFYLKALTDEEIALERESMMRG